MLWRRLIGASGIPAPLWVTTSPLPDAAWEEPYTQTLLATTSSSPIAYSITTGTLPVGMSFSGDTISGTPSPDPDAPAWVTMAGNLGAAEQGSAFSSDLDATGAVSFVVRSGLLPWGLWLDTVNGVLSGTLAVIGGAEDAPSGAPTWVTAAGSLGTVRNSYNGTSDPVSISLSATGGTIYTIVSGGLPWGVTMNRDTGALTGFALFVGNDGVWEPDTAVTWSAPASTNLGTFARGASVGTIAQTVDPVGSSFYVIGGVMPWGVLLGRNSGTISGTVSNENATGTYSFTVASAANPGFAFGTRTYSITIT